MISSIPLLEIINFGTLNPKIFSCISGSATDVAAVNPNGIKRILVNGLSIFFTKSRPVFSYCPRILPRNAPNSTILDS